MKPLKLTFDWNCVIALENNEASSGAIRSLIGLHRAGQIEVALLAASASESTRSKTFPENGRLFSERIVALCLDDLPLVPVPGVTSLTYLSPHTVLVDGAEFERLTDALWRTMFPKISKNPVDYLPLGQKLTDELIWSTEFKPWRNKFCDVITAYSHIASGRDILVTTNTDDFQSNRNALEALGLRAVLKPDGALLRVTGG